MCFSVYKPYFIWRQAEENMKVWKIVYPTSGPTPTVLSAVQDFPYRLGKKYTMPLEDITRDMDVEISAIIEYNIYTGFHSYETEGRARYEYWAWPNKVCMAECTIPKGAMYMTDGCGCIVSNEIIIDKIV